LRLRRAGDAGAYPGAAPEEIGMDLMDRTVHRGLRLTAMVRFSEGFSPHFCISQVLELSEDAENF